MLPVFEPLSAPVLTTLRQEALDSDLEADYPEFDEALLSIEPAQAALVNDDTFKLHSRPGSKYTIYLDFDGGITEGTGWNNSTGIETLVDIAYSRDSDSSSFTSSELSEIRSIWKLVAEDFAPFDVNVTTEDPGTDALTKSGGSDTTWGIRSLHTTNTNKVCGGCGGVAYIGSFNSSIDLPAYSFNKGVSAGGNTQSHEIGHSVQLGHDGLSGGTTYYKGHGSGNTTWGPIMGGIGSRKLKTWSNGDYFNSSNQQDDLDRISTLNGFSYRPDDHGNAIATASPLARETVSLLSGSGVIEQSNDIDFFSFTTEAGLVSFDIDPFLANPNLDVWAGIYDSNGALVAESNPFDQVSASFNNLDLAAGKYSLRVEGVGTHGVYNAALDRVFDPGEEDYTGSETEPPWSVDGPEGYSDYASVGQYWITGSRVAATSDWISIEGVNAARKEGESGATAFTFRVSRNGESDPELQVAYAVLPDIPDSDSTLSPHTVDDEDFVVGALPSGFVTIPSGEDSSDFVIEVSGDAEFERDESFRVVIFDPTAGWTISGSTALATIVSDESAVGVASVNSAMAAQPEGDPDAAASYVFTLVRNGDTTVSTTVQWEIEYTGFTNPASDSDFVDGIRPAGTVIFDPGVTEVDVIIDVAGDLEVESDESFLIAVTDVTGANESLVDPATSSRRGIIQEDESPVALLDQVQFRWRQIRHSGNARDLWALDNVSLSTILWEDDFDPDVDGPQWSGIENGGVNSTSSIFPSSNGQELLMDGAGDRIATSISVQPAPGATLRFDLIIGNGTGANGNGADNAESGKDVWLEYSVDGQHWDVLKKMDTDDYESWVTVDVPLPDRAIVPSSSTSEGDLGVTPMSFKIVRSGNLAKSAVVDWQVVPSATDPIDENDIDLTDFPSGSISFAVNQDVRTIMVPILGDVSNEANESFDVFVSNSNAGPVTGGIRTGQVLNDDGPAVGLVGINDGFQQRSSIRELTIQFEGLVDTTAAAFSLSKLGTPSAPAEEPVENLVVNFTDQAGDTTASLKLPGGVSLPDGNYRLDIDGSQVTARSGGWAMNEDFSFGTDAADNFYRKYGDVNGNQLVDLLDFAEFRRAFGLSVGQPGYLDELDSDDDGAIGLLDFAAFRQNFGT